MSKWEYIHQISQCGAQLKTDGVLRLLEWCGKPNTASVTEQEALTFLDMLQNRLAAGPANR